MDRLTLPQLALPRLALPRPPFTQRRPIRPAADAAHADRYAAWVATLDDLVEAVRARRAQD